MAGISLSSYTLGFLLAMVLIFIELVNPVCYTIASMFTPPYLTCLHGRTGGGGGGWRGWPLFFHTDLPYLFDMYPTKTWPIGQYLAYVYKLFNLHETATQGQFHCMLLCNCFRANINHFSDHNNI